MLKQKFAKKAMGAFFAASLATGLMLAPASAFAKSGSYDVDDASITITGINDEDTVKFYQVFDADIDATNNLTYNTKVVGLPAEYDTAAEVVGKDGRTVADAIASTVTAGTPTYTVKAEGGKVSQSLDSGLYLVTVTTTSGKTKVYQTMLVDASPKAGDNGKYVTATLADTAAKSQDVPAPEKKVVPSAGGNGATTTDTYSVGDIAQFQIGATIPSFPANATYAFYSITDTPDAGLAIDGSTVKVYGADGSAIDAANYEVSLVDGALTVAFKSDYLKGNPGQKISVTYSAKVNAINMATGVVGNKVVGTFTPNPYEDSKVTTEPSKTEVKTYGFTFKKVKPNGGALSGAEFTVTDGNGKAVTYVDAAGTTHADGKVVSDANGYVYVNGLEAGTYTITETGVPAGFQKVDPFQIVLNDSDTGDSPATLDVTESNFDLTTSEVIDPEQGKLPTTGGAGTIALTAGGILLVAGGSALALRNRSRKNN